MKRNMNKYFNKMLVFMMVIAMSLAVTACGKNSGVVKSDNGTDKKTEGTAGTDQGNGAADTAGTEGTETDGTAAQAGGENTTAPQQERILEDGGEIEIVVPDDEETFGE